MFNYYVLLKYQGNLSSRLKFPRGRKDKPVISTRSQSLVNPVGLALAGVLSPKALSGKDWYLLGN